MKNSRGGSATRELFKGSVERLPKSIGAFKWSSVLFVTGHAAPYFVTKIELKMDIKDFDAVDRMKS